MGENNSIRDEILRADRQLSRFNPLGRILFFDDFDDGMNGWCELIGNHDGNLDNVRALTTDLRPPQISSCTFWDIGTHGSVDGIYSLKLATRARAGHMSQAIKRLTMVRQGLVQFETYLTFKSEQVFDRRKLAMARGWDGNYDPSEADFGEFTLSNDVNEGVDKKRYHIALRYLNSDFSGNLVNRWMYKTSVQPTTKMVRSSMVAANLDYHVIDPKDWKEVPEGHQRLCYNEVPTKINWHYVRWLFDTTKRRSVELQVNDLVMDLRDVPVPVYDHPYEACEKLLNFCIDVRTHRDVRNFLFLDSVLVSVDW
jgi:hypothetical protein